MPRNKTRGTSPLDVDEQSEAVAGKKCGVCNPHAHTEVDGVATTGAVLWQLFGAKVATASRKMRRDLLGFVAPNTSEWGLSSGTLLFRGALK